MFLMILILLHEILINAGLNNLFGEVSWYYCSSGSNVVDRVVTYNYLESVMLKKPIWYTGTLARTAHGQILLFLQNLMVVIILQLIMLPLMWWVIPMESPFIMNMKQGPIKWTPEE